MITETMLNEPTVFVVDGDAATRKAVQGLVSTMNLECLAYDSASEFLESDFQDRAGCVLMDIRLPDVNGLKIQQEFNERGILLPIVFLTSTTTVSIAVHALRSGAVHVLEKPFRDHELWEAIQEAIDLDRKRRQERRRQAERQRMLAELDEKDHQVLEMYGRGLTKTAMAHELDVCTRTVEFRRTRLMKKLGTRTQNELIRLAVQLAVENGETAAERRNGNGNGNGNGSTTGGRYAAKPR